MDTSTQNVTTGSHTCTVCGESFNGKHRSNKLTCSDSCRKQLSRYPANISGSIDRTLRSLDLFSDALRIPEHQERVISALKMIRAEVDEILESVTTGCHTNGGAS